MELPDYVQSISFRVALPDMPGSKAVQLAAAVLSRAGFPLDVLNTRLPRQDRQTGRTLRDARRTCPAGTVAIGAIINRAVARLADGEAFLSLGVGDGFPLLAAIGGNPGKRCIGVDLFTGPVRGHELSRRAAFLRRFESLRTAEHNLHRLDFREYFARPGQVPVGCCMIGTQSSDDVLQRLEACEPHLAENAVVLIENANRAAVRSAGLAFIRSSENQYRVLLDRPTPHHGGLTFGNGLLLFQLLGRNALAHRRVEEPASLALVPAA